IEHISALLADEKEILSELIEIQQKTKDKLSELNKQLTISEDDLAEKLEELKSEYIEHLNIQAAKRNEKQSVHDQKEQLDLRKNKQTEMSEQLVTKRHQLMDETKEIKEKDRKSTRLNSSHVSSSYAVFCLKKKKIERQNR